MSATVPVVLMLLSAAAPCMCLCCRCVRVCVEGDITEKAVAEVLPTIVSNTANSRSRCLDWWRMYSASMSSVAHSLSAVAVC